MPMGDFQATFPGDWSRGFLAACSLGIKRNPSLENKNSGSSQTLDACKALVERARLIPGFQPQELERGKGEKCPILEGELVQETAKTGHGAWKMAHWLLPSH